MSVTPARSVRLSELAVGRDNNLNLLRFLAATAVVYAHSFGALGLTNAEPFFRLFGKGLGDLGVDVFFVLSGLLVTKSLLGKKALGDFAWARIMRIFPALIVSNVLWIVVIGCFFSPLGAAIFWQLDSTLTYLLKNSSMLPGLGAQTDLPFAFDSTSSEFNVPLWTLPHELQMYALLVVFAITGITRHRLMLATIAAIGFASLIANYIGYPTPLDAIRSRFIFFFFGGASAYLYRDVLVLRGSLTAILLFSTIACATITADLAVKQLVLAAATPYVAIWFAFVPTGHIRRFNAAGDYSYGIYILAFPLQLILEKNLRPIGPLAHFAVSMCLVLPLAAASWHLIESRFLQLSPPRFLQRIWRLQKQAQSTAETQRPTAERP